MNYIIFNHDGSIKNVNFAEIIVQGNNLVDEIFVAVEGRSTDSYSATAFFELPNGEANFLTATLASHSIDQSPYNGYKFVLTEAQTALYGKVRMSIKLEGMQGEALWTYNQILTINKSGYNPDFTTITMSQYAALIQAMGSLQEKFVVNNARFYSSLANAQADLGNLAFNQCVIIADTSATDPIPQIYFKNAESQLELLAGIGEYTFQAGPTTTNTLTPGSAATASVSFVASGKTITMNFEFGIPKGDTGATGNGIASIEKYSTEGQVDTYRITYTNGSHFDFDVTNGTLAGHLLSTTFEYDEESIDSLSLQLAKEIRRLVDTDGSKIKSIMASKPTSAGGVQTYSIVWDYNVNIVPGALNIESGDFYFEDDGTLTSIDSHLEDYTFSIFHEVDGITIADIGYFELSSSDTSGDLDDDQAEEARKTICFIKRGNEIFHFDQEYEGGTRYFKTIPSMGVTGYKQGSIEISGLNSNSPTWEYASEDYDMDSAPTLNSTNLVTSGGVYSALAEKANVSTKIAGISMSSDISTVDLLKALGNSNSKVSKLTQGIDYVITNDRYIKIGNGTIGSYNGCSVLTLSVLLHKGETIIFKSVGMASQSLSNNIATLQVYESRTKSDDTTITLGRKNFPLGALIYAEKNPYCYTATHEGEYIRISGETSELTSFGVYKITPIQNNYDSIDNLTDLKWIASAYIYSNQTGSNFNALASNGNTIRSQIITLNRGDILHISGKFSSFGNVSTCIYACETDSSCQHLIRAIITGSIDVTTAEFDDKSYVASKDGENIIVFIETSENSKAFIYVERAGKKNQVDKMDSLMSIDNYASCIFRSVICVGDSITQGIVNYQDGGSNISMTSEANYPKFLAQLGNWKVKNAGVSGSSPTTWWNNGLKERYDFSKYDCCLIALGVNGGLTDTIDEDTTVGAGEDYNDYANTETGRYCSLIEFIQDHNPNIKIFIQKYNINNDETSTTSVVISKIAAKYNLPLINWFDSSVIPLRNSYSYVYGETDYQSLHYNGQGYLAIAKLVISQMSKEVIGKPKLYQMDKGFTRKTDDYNFFNDGLPMEEGLYFIKATVSATTASLDTTSYSYQKIQNPPSDGTYVLKATKSGSSITYEWVEEI